MTSHASRGPSAASTPRAAWNVTVVPEPPLNTRNVSIWPPDAATTESPLPKLRTNSTVHAPTPTMTTRSRIPHPMTHRRRDERRGSVGGIQDDAGAPGHGAGVGADGGIPGAGGGPGGWGAAPDEAPGGAPGCGGGGPGCICRS